MLFMAMCLLVIWGLGIISAVFCRIPQVKKAIEKLLSI